MIKTYLDSYNQITVNVSKNYYGGKISSLYMLTKYGPQKLKELQLCEKFEDYIEYTVELDDSIELGEEYYLLDDHGFKTLLEYRYITKEERFRKETYTDSYLGCHYTKEETSFSIWAPISNEVILVLNGNESYKMRKQGNVFYCVISRNLEKYEYYYLIKNNGKYSKVLDPYSYSYNYDQSASVVIDLDKIEKNIELKVNKKSKVIYETNVRDFSSSKKGKYKSKFLGLIEDENIEYLDNLGIEYLQLMPINYFNGDVYNSDAFYNWGYNPCLHGVAHPNYVYNIENPYSVINECKTMINKLHERGIKITLDVVFNHLENRDDNVLNLIVPYYYYLMKDGEVSNGSLCGVDLDSKAPMMNRFIKDMCKRWVKLYDVDGFRFDLMGILDYQTINEVCDELKVIKPYILVCGEGWNMPSLMPDEDKAVMTNADKMHNVAFFNDYYRESLKYDYIGENVIGGDYVLNNNVYFDFSKSINYLECHDNYTYYDLQTYIELRDEHFALKRQMFKNLIILLSNGYAFFHSGQEFFRTKKGSENSYCKLDDINMFDWNRMYKFSKEVNLVEKMIKIREKHNLFAAKYEYLNEAGIISVRNDDILVVINISDRVLQLDKKEILLTTNKKQLDKYDLVIYKN
jgi:pullulanase